MKNGNIVYISIIVLLLVYILQQCNKIENTSGDIVITKRDTLIVKGQPDTVYFPVKEVVTKWLKPEVKEVEVFTSSNGIDTLKTYETNYTDSFIDAKIFSKVKGELFSSQLSYVKKFPKFIYQTDTVKIKNETTILKREFNLYGGVIIGGNQNSFTVLPSIIFKTKKNMTYQVGYELVNKTYNFGIFTKIKKPFRNEKKFKQNP